MYVSENREENEKERKLKISVFMALLPTEYTGKHPINKEKKKVFQDIQHLKIQGSTWKFQVVAKT